ncbi:MAG: HAD family phosphatase [Bacteroidetes bacterium]|nr:MAG: HAD family phosphatase [Bacteroidota bacterium]
MKAIRSIIFDLGGVLFDINYQNIIDSFKKLGLGDFDAKYTQLKQDHLFDELETGNISASEFRNRIREIAGKDLNDDEINNAWNSILIGFPKKNIDLLVGLKDSYRIFLLSNTNEIHEKAYKAMLRNQYGNEVLDELFEKIYLSHRVHLRKPNKEIFQLVIDENNLNVEETLFIDDSPQHIEGAKQVGLQAILLKNDKWVGNLLKEVLP